MKLIKNIDQIIVRAEYENNERSLLFSLKDDELSISNFLPSINKVCIYLYEAPEDMELLGKMLNPENDVPMLPQLFGYILGTLVNSKNYDILDTELDSELPEQADMIRSEHLLENKKNLFVMNVLNIRDFEENKKVFKYVMKRMKDIIKSMFNVEIDYIIAELDKEMNEPPKNEYIINVLKNCDFTESSTAKDCYIKYVSETKN